VATADVGVALAKLAPPSSDVAHEATSGDPGAGLFFLWSVTHDTLEKPAVAPGAAHTVKPFGAVVSQFHEMPTHAEPSVPPGFVTALGAATAPPATDGWFHADALLKVKSASHEKGVAGEGVGVADAVRDTVGETVGDTVGEGVCAEARRANERRRSSAALRPGRPRGRAGGRGGIVDEALKRRL